MLNVSTEFLDVFVRKLDYLISISEPNRNNLSAFNIEYIDSSFGARYVVFIENKKYIISTFTDKNTITYVLNNIEKIDYICNIDEKIDSIVGDIQEFIINRYHTTMEDFKYICAVHKYMTYIKNSETVPVVGDITTFIERNVCEWS